MKDMVEGGGTVDEVSKAVQVTFYEIWDSRIILEVVTDSVEIQELIY